jgi:hypothetical protein
MMPLKKPRPRQKGPGDCVPVVFRYITGEDEVPALGCFLPYLNGQAGVSLDALRCCLTKAGYKITPYDVPQGIDVEFWRSFQGEVVMLYTLDNWEIAHTVLVRSGGIVIDPDCSSPEDGQFIEDYFKAFGGKNITIKSVSKVTHD